MVEEIGDITKNLLNWIMNFDLDSLMNLFYINIKDAFDCLNFEPLLKEKIYWCPNYLAHRCYDKDDNLVYKGQVKDNMRHGFGTEYYRSTDKVKFDGKFMDNLPNGNFCKYFDENGFEIYAGHFCNGQPIGGYFFDDRNSTLYIGKFCDYEQDGKNCYIIDKNDLMLSSGRFIKGKPFNKEFKMYYQSGCVLYKGSSEETVLGHFYHDGLFRHDSDNQINSKAIMFPEKKTDLQADINFILNETMKGTDLMTLKYEFYEQFNYKQVLLTSISKNEDKKILHYLSSNNKGKIHKNITMEKDPSNGKTLMKVYYPNQNDCLAMTIEGDKNNFYLKSVTYTPAYLDKFFKMEEIMIDDYSEANCVSVLSDNCIYDGEIKQTFNYVITDEFCKKNEFGYIGFIPKVDICGLFRVYNTNWQLLYYGNLQNKKRSKYGIYNLGNLMIQAFWKDNSINGPVRFLELGCIRFSGKINNLPQSAETKLELSEPTTSTGNIIEFNLPPSNCMGLCKWYHKNGKLGYIGYTSDGERDSKFGIDFNKSGSIIYLGGYSENQFNGRGVELYTGMKENQKGIKRWGTFKNGKLTGENCLRNINGTIDVGYFENGNLVTP